MKPDAWSFRLSPGVPRAHWLSGTERSDGTPGTAARAGKCRRRVVGEKGRIEIVGNNFRTDPPGMIKDHDANSARTPTFRLGEPNPTLNFIPIG